MSRGKQTQLLKRLPICCFLKLEFGIRTLDDKMLTSLMVDAWKLVNTSFFHLLVSLVNSVSFFPVVEENWKLLTIQDFAHDAQKSDQQSDLEALHLFCPKWDFCKKGLWFEKRLCLLSAPLDSQFFVSQVWIWWFFFLERSATELECHESCDNAKAPVAFWVICFGGSQIMWMWSGFFIGFLLSMLHFLHQFSANQ